MKKNFSINILSGIIISYLLLALIWWTILLLQKNEDAYISKADNIKLYQEKTLGIREYDISKDHEYLALTEGYDKQRLMILGEGIFFGLSMIVGISMILRSSKRMISTNKQQNNFLLAITHELKTPVAAVKLILQTLVKRTLNKDQIDTLTSNALQENQRLESLIDNVLLSTKLMDGYDFHRESIDYKELINKCILRQQQRVKGRQIQFVSLSQMDSVFIHADSTAIMIALNNVIDNALKYSEDDIMLSLSDGNKGKIILTIADTGIGIAAKEKTQIFEKFYRSGSEETRASKGTGLGLYLVSEIVNAHQGTITYRANEPKGSQFLIELDLIK